MNSKTFTDKTRDIKQLMKTICVDMDEQTQIEVIWSLVLETSLHQSYMNRIDGGYEIIIPITQEDEEE